MHRPDPSADHLVSNPARRELLRLLAYAGGGLCLGYLSPGIAVAETLARGSELAAAAAEPANLAKPVNLAAGGRPAAAGGPRPRGELGREDARDDHQRDEE